MTRRSKPQWGTSLSEDVLEIVAQYAEANNVTKSQVVEIGILLATQLSLEQIHRAIIRHKKGEPVRLRDFIPETDEEGSGAHDTRLGKAHKTLPAARTCRMPRPAPGQA